MFQTIFVNPLFNALVYLYNTVAFGDFGLAVIFLTLLIRFVLYPFFYKGVRNQMLLQRIQPEIKRVQEDHKDNKEKQAQALMELYKKHDVNPFSSILLLFIQLPVLIALYRVFLEGFSPEMLSRLYSFVSAPDVLHTTFLGLIDLKEKSIFIVGLAAIIQYIQGYQTLPKIEKGKELSSAEKISKQMVLFSPILTVVILANFPSAVGLYWLVTGIFSVVQQYYVNKSIKI